MLKTVLIIACILILVGMLGLDFFISHDLEKGSKKDDSNNDDVKNDDK